MSNRIPTSAELRHNSREEIKALRAENEALRAALQIIDERLENCADYHKPAQMPDALIVGASLCSMVRGALAKRTP